VSISSPPRRHLLVLTLGCLAFSAACDGVERAPARSPDPPGDRVGPPAPPVVPPPPVAQSPEPAPAKAIEPQPSDPPGRAPVAANPKLLEARPYELSIPPGLDRSRPAPLVIYLHGYGASPSRLREVLGLPEVAREAGVIVATPGGSREAGRSRLFWNATPACCDFRGAGVDDVTYLATVIDDARRRAAVDERQVFVVGYSNGGFMAHRLACELSDRIAGIASVSGSTFLDEGSCHPTEPVAVLQIHGDADPIVDYSGGHVLNKLEVPPHPSAVETVARWAKLNGCGGAATADPIDLESDLPGPETLVQRHAGCRSGAAELWTVRGGDHFIAQTPSASRHILAFLRSHPKPPSVEQSGR
jgi:polyhydroxybutyrate depolymerase